MVHTCTDLKVSDRSPVLLRLMIFKRKNTNRLCYLFVRFITLDGRLSLYIFLKIFFYNNIFYYIK